MVVEKNKLFVGNLDNRAKRFHLKEFFAQYGEVTYTKVVVDRETKRSRWFGFVVFATDEDAAHALETGNGAIIELPEISFPERPIRLMYAEAPTERPESHMQRAENYSSQDHEIQQEEAIQEDVSSEETE